MRKVLKVMGAATAAALITGMFAVNADAYQMNSRKAMTLDFNSNDETIMDISDGYSNESVFNCTWRNKNVAFRDGKVNLTIDKELPGSSKPYSGAEYRTKDHFGFGMYETKMKPIKNDGVVSSFFTYTGPSEDTVWDEIDIEFLGKDTTKVQFNYYTDGVGNHEFLYDLGFDASQSFHTYGFDWQQDHITWYVDSKPVYTAKENIPQTPGQIMMNVWPGITVDDWLKPFNGNTPLTAQYDYLSYKSNESGNTDKPVGDEPAIDKPVSGDAQVTVKGNQNPTFEVKALKDLDLSKLTLRYYFTKGDTKAMNFFCDNASINLNKAPWYKDFTGKTSGKISSDANGSYIDIKVADNFVLTPADGTLKVQGRLANVDWSLMNNFKAGKVVALYK